MRLPAREVWLHHSVTAATGNPLADMRTLERIGVQRFGRLSYSWALHPNGSVMEGAGVTVGAHTGGRNSTSFGIVWIGNYETDRPTPAQIEATAALIRHLLDEGLVRAGTYPTGGHRDLKATACPGRHAYAALDTIRQLVANPEEDDMPHYTIYTTDANPSIRVAVDGALVGFPNPTELAEFLAPYKAQGFVEKRIHHREGDDWDRYMRSTAAVRASDGAAAVLAAVRGIDTGDVDEAALAASLAPLLDANTRVLSDADLAAVATAVADEQHRRTAD